MNSPLLFAIAGFVVGTLVGGGTVGALLMNRPGPEPVVAAPVAEQTAEGVVSGGPAAETPAPTPDSISGVLQTGDDGPSLILGPEVVEADADFAEVLAAAKARGAAMTVCAKQGQEASLGERDIELVTIEGDERAPSVSQATASYRCAPISIDLSKLPDGSQGLGQVDGGL